MGAAREGLGIRAAATIVASAAALPFVYLVWRVADFGWQPAIDIVVSSRTANLIARTVGLATAVTTASILIAVPVAWLTVRSDLAFGRLWTVLTALPLAIPTYVGSWAMIGALGPRGMLQGWLEPFGIERIPELYGFFGAFIVLTLFSYPYVLLTVRASWQRLDPSLEEASRTLGHSAARTFWSVVLPQLRPAIVAGGLLVALYTMSDFGAVSMLRYDTLTRAIFVQYRGALNRGSAAALGLVLVGLTATVLSIEQRARRRDLHRLHGSGARRAAPVALGRWRWPALIGLGTLVTLALVVPMAVIVFWLQRGRAAGEPIWPETSLIADSITGSLLGATVTVLAALPVAIVIVRRPGRLARIVEQLSWSGYALPGVVVALALVFFGARQVTWAYQTLGMLVFAYAVLFLPQAIGSVRASLNQVTPSVEEAARVLGASRASTFRRVLLPLIRPGLGAGWLLVALTAMKELPATLLLAPTGFSTLATRVWNATAENFMSRAAGAALALVLLASLPTAILIAGEERRRTSV
ncbi:MAG: ABC transporter permease [Ilumatobacteraceae bacterium]